METGTIYKNNISSMQKLKDFSGRVKYQEEFAQNFETIFAKATEVDIKLDNANEFLQSLSKDELTTLQKYASLADSINIDELSDEASYNLLMHDDEKYDFNNDGMTQEKKRDPAVQKFLDDLSTKEAVVFLADFNKEKIEKK
ncbi:MAG: hypothetical protein COB17_07610 [Sulfurimonas sp.]|nr:MAG: hypothetical protein COB17_07610 [Sulfurimonas sp.]